MDGAGGDGVGEDDLFFSVMGVSGVFWVGGGVWVGLDCEGEGGRHTFWRRLRKMMSLKAASFSKGL